MADFSALRLPPAAKVYPRLVPGVGSGYLWPEGLICPLAGVAYYLIREWISFLKAKA